MTGVDLRVGDAIDKIGANAEYDEELGDVLALRL
jgi:hypothetical protein